MYKIKRFQAASAMDSPRSSGLNAGGDICGGVYTSTGAKGAVWTSTNTSNPQLSVANSYFYDINSARHAVGAMGMNNTPTQRACIFKNGQLIDLYNFVGEYSLASKINDSGRVVGWTHNSGDGRGFVFDSANNHVEFIAPLAGDEDCGAFGVNDAGDVVAKSGNNRVLLWVDGEVTEIGELTFVDGINAGRLVVGSIGKPSPANYRATVIDASTSSPTAIELPLPSGAQGSHGMAINDKGSVVGTSWNSSTYNGAQHAFVYDNGVSIDLNDLIPSNSGWRLEFAYGINNAGQIVCDGEYFGEPATAVLTPQTIGRPGIERFDKLLVATLFGGVAQDGGGFVIVGGKPVPIDPWGPLREIGSQLTPERRNILLAMAGEALASGITIEGVRESLREASVRAAQAGLDALLKAPAQHSMRSSVEEAEPVLMRGGTKAAVRKGRRVN